MSIMTRRAERATSWAVPLVLLALVFVLGLARLALVLVTG